MKESEQIEWNCDVLESALNGFVELMRACHSHVKNESAFLYACNMLYLEVNDIKEKCILLANGFKEELPLRSDKFRFIDWANLISQLESCHKCFLENKIYAEALEQATEKSDEFLLRGNALLFDVSFGQLVNVIKSIVELLDDVDEPQMYADYWRRESENYSLTEWAKNQEKIRHKIQSKTQLKREEYCNKKIDEVTNLLKQTAEDCINSKDLCICEEALGRLLWSYGRDDEENFSKLLFNVKSLKHYCGLVNKSLTVINVENCDGDDEVREREQEIEKAKQNVLQIAIKATQTCRIHLADGFEEDFLTSVWDDILDSDLDYDMALKLNKSAGRNLIICQVIGIMAKEGVLQAKSAELVECFFSVLFDSRKLSKAEKAKKKKTCGSNMTPTKLSAVPNVQNWIHIYIEQYRNNTASETRNT